MVQYRRGRKSPWVVQVHSFKGDLITRSFSRKDDAETFERQESRKRQLAKAGLAAPAEEILFIDGVKSWLTKRFTGKASSYKQDESRLRNYWIEPFGAYPLSSITSAMIKERLDYIQFELEHAPADRNRHRALLHTFFQDLYLDDKIVHNPVSKVPLVSEKKKVRSFGSIQDPKDQESYIKALYREGPQYGMLGDLMLWTGARIMAATCIQYRDIDFEMGIVRIRRLFERASQSVQERTKGSDEQGEEVVPLFPVLKDRILSMRRVSQYTRPSDYIACQENGSPIPYETFMGVHDRALLTTGLPRFTPHALKKAFATNLKRAGYTRTEIQEMFGHSSDAVTARYDLKDIEHLVEKGKRLKFGSSVSQVSAKSRKSNRIGGGRNG